MKTSEEESKIITSYCHRKNVDFLGIKRLRGKAYSRRLFQFRCLADRPDHPKCFSRRLYELKIGPQERGCPICVWDDRRVPEEDILRSMEIMRILTYDRIPLNKSISMNFVCWEREHEITASLKNLETRYKKRRIACHKCDRQVLQESLLDKFVGPGIMRLGNYIDQFTDIEFLHKTESINHIFSIEPKYAKRIKKIDCTICKPGTRKTPLEEIRRRANPNLLLEFTEYENDQSRVSVRCRNCGEKYKTSISNIKDHCGCRFCEGKAPITANMIRRTVDVLNLERVSANRPTFEFLKLIHKNKKKYADLICSSHGPFRVPAIQFRAENAGCMKCGINQRSNTQRLPFEKIRNRFAKKFPRWKLLTTNVEYQAGLKRLTVKCSKGHISSPLLHNILGNQSSCGECVSDFKSWGEMMVRTILNEITGKTFYSKSILISDKTFAKVGTRFKPLKPLQVDGLCPELMLAFEFHGDQHFKFIPFFHETEEDFWRQQAYDLLKREEIKLRGYALIEIAKHDLNPETLSKKFCVAGIKAEEDQIQEILHYAR